MKIYLAGPMRGYPAFNFPAFDEAAKRLWGRGHVVLSPADLDRQAGFDLPRLAELDATEFAQFMREATLRDVDAVTQCDAVAVLPGWEKSKGSAIEVAVALSLGKPILDAATLEEVPVTMTMTAGAKEVPPAEEDVLEEALRITRGDRNNAYGPPDQDFARTAAMWSAIKGVEFDAKDVALFMVCLKISRATWMSKRDNWTDMAGYARCGYLCEQAAARREWLDASA